jgi:lipoyl(octanoyl) transferase
MSAGAIECRLVIDDPLPGDWNMAVDEALLEQAAEAGSVCLRLYEWSEPTLSLGYFQPLADRARHAASRNCPLVRRSSGGGAILHDRELTYSLALPSGHRLARQAEELYIAAHETLIEALATLGVAAGMNRAVSGLAPEAEPFLCFERRAVGDVLVGDAKIAGSKIAGSAQRRRRGAVLQHGSILLETSPQAPELQGIEQLTGAGLKPADLERAWLPTLQNRLGLQFRRQPLTAAEFERARTLVAEKFGNPSWNVRR